MSQETIDVGLTANDGSGDPLRTAFIKCNNNFTQLFATSSLPPRIANGASSVNIPQGGGNVVVTVNSTANIALFTQNGVYVTGIMSASGNVNGANLKTTGIMSAGGNVNGGNLLTTGQVSASGNLTGSNVVTSGSVSATGNITSGNISASGTIIGSNIETGGAVSAAGNVVAGNGSFFIGDGGLLSNVTISSNVAVTQIANGTSIIGIAGVNGNSTISVGNVGNVVVFSSAGQWVTGLISVTGNVRSGNLISLGSTQTTGNVTGGNFNTGGIVSATGNVIGGNLVTTGFVISSGNVTGGNILTSGAVSATGNVTGGNILGSNILTTGAISATGNITGNYIIGDASQLTGVTTSLIQNGTSNVKVVSTGGNVSVNVSGIANVVVYSTTGEYVNGLVSASGNITGGNLSGTNITGTNITGTITTASQTNITEVGTLTSLNSGAISSSGNITGANFLTAGLISAAGNITAGNLTVGTGTMNVGQIRNTNANGVGNIGSIGGYFNTVFALASSAQYADLAEYYTADADYEPGTVVKFGGNFEITIASRDNDPEVAGVISTNPAYAMNTGIKGTHTVALALQGRVPCKVIGPVRKGQMMVSAGNGYAQASIKPEIGTVIGKALENFDGNQGVIEVVVGRL